MIGFEQYTDKEIVSKILAHDQLIIEYFFLKKCSPVFMYILHSVFDGKIDVKELINELLLYLSENNWHKLRQFDYRSRLTTWVRVVAVRFFVKKRNELIERGGYSALNTMKEQGFTPHAFMDRRMDLQKALNAMPNERYRKVIVALDGKHHALRINHQDAYRCFLMTTIIGCIWFLHFQEIFSSLLIGYRRLSVLHF